MVGAHESLYRTAEIRVVDAGQIEVCFSIHAPELMMDPDLDVNAVGDEWLASLTDSEITLLKERSRKLVCEQFHISLDQSRELSLAAVVFESSDLIRNPNREGGARPGCLFASMTLAMPKEGLTLHYEPGAGKRLLLAVVRNGAFPKVHDLAPGDSKTFLLKPSS